MSLIKGGIYQDSLSGLDARTVAILLPLKDRNGHVFFLASVDKRHIKDLKILTHLIESHAERLAKGFGKSANCQHRFEQFLAQLNEECAEAARAGAYKLAIDKFHAVIGIACDDMMLLSGTTGDLTALFLHRLPPQKYQVFNLARSIQTEQALPSWEKPFGVILDGVIAPGDVLCLANQDIQNAIDNEELNSVLSTLPPNSASAKIRQYFPHNTHLAILILQIQELESQAETTDKAAPLSALSMGALGRAEDETDRLLADQKMQFKNLPVKEAFEKIGSALQSLRAKLPKRKKSNEEFAESTEKTVSKRAKVLFGAAAALLLIFVISIAFLSRTETEIQAQEQFGEVRNQIVDMTEKGAAAIIYKDENQARRFYLEAQTLLENLETETPEQAEEKTRLENTIQSALSELRHIVSIPDPPLSATFPNGVKGIALLEADELYYALASDKRIYAFDPGNKSLELLETDPAEIGMPIQGTSEDGLVYFLDDRPGISRYNVDAESFQVTRTTPSDGTKWTDLTLYANKLYVLETAGVESEGQILRFPRSGSGFGAPTRWIRSKSTDLTDAVSLAIDGTIFVLKRDGTITRFSSGSEVGWEPGIIDPPLANAKSLWTDIDSDFLYVLEPSQRRVVVLKKETGEFIVQYRSDKFDSLTEFFIDEKTRTIYLLNGEDILAISASHLE